MRGAAIEQVSSRNVATAASIWWKAVRPFSFPASAMPALIGVALAWIRGYDLSLSLAVLTLVAAVTAHAGANLIQDYFDYTSGIDRPGTLGGSGLLVSGVISPGSALLGSIVCFSAAALLGVPMIMRGGITLLSIVIAGFVLAAGYAIPGVGLKYRAMGDVAVFLAFGVGITLGSYVVQTRSFDFAPVACGAAFGFLVVAILAANNIRDRLDDAKTGVCTLNVILGERGSRVYYMFIVLAAYVIPVLFVLMNVINPGALFVFATFPPAYGLMRHVWTTAGGDQRTMVSVDARAARLSLSYGAAMIAGMVAWKFLTQTW